MLIQSNSDNALMELRPFLLRFKSLKYFIKVTVTLDKITFGKAFSACKKIGVCSAIPLNDHDKHVE